MKAQKNSVRQKLLNLQPGESATFPVARLDYVTSAAYRVGKTSGRRFSRQTVGKQVRITRVE